MSIQRRAAPVARSGSIYLNLVGDIVNFFVKNSCFVSRPPKRGCPAFRHHGGKWGICHLTSGRSGASFFPARSRRTPSVSIQQNPKYLVNGRPEWARTIDLFHVKVRLAGLQKATGNVTLRFKTLSGTSWSASSSSATLLTNRQGIASRTGAAGTGEQSMNTEKWCALRDSNSRPSGS